MQQTTSHHQNYGTMEGNRIIDATTEEGTTQEPPKPAVRRKMQTNKLNPTTTTATNPSNVIKLNQAEQSEAETNIDPSDRGNLSECHTPNEQYDDRNADNEPNIRVIETIQKSITSSNHRGPIGAKNSNLPLPASHLAAAASTSSSGGSTKRPYPKAVLFIVANEFCERFSYYGLRAILVLYFRSVLGFSDANSTVSFHVFATLCYLTPILGAVLADSIWGKFKTILYLSLVYLLGEITLMMASIFWHYDGATVAATFLGLALIGIGTGGIKPCVSALGGDQFLPEEQTRRENFFSLFYATINIGSLMSTFATPILRSRYGCFGRSDCYPVAFAVPCLLMLCSLLLFLMARKQYVLNPLPRENVLLAFVQCSYLAIKRKLFGHSKQDQINHRRDYYSSSREEINASSETSDSSNLSISSEENNQKQLVARLPTESGGQAGNLQLNTDKSTRVSIVPRESQRNATRSERRPKHWLHLASDRFDSKSIQDFKSVWSFILLILPTSVYWCLYDQQSSLWTLQATRMETRVFETNLIIEPDQMGLLNPLLLLTMIPIFQLVVYPTFNKCNILNTPVQKMTVGGLMAALTFVTSALIEVQIQQNLPSEQPRPGYARVLLVNGLNDCTLDSMKISYVPIPNVLTTQQLITAATSNDTQQLNHSSNQTISSLSSSSSSELVLDYLEPLNVNQVELLTADSHDMLNNYKFQFKLSSNPSSSSSQSHKNTNSSVNPPVGGCPFDLGKENEFIIRPLADNTAKMLYLDQGNGKLTYKLFNDSLKLPSAGKTRVRLLFEVFGSYVQAEKRIISLVRLSDTADEIKKPHPELDFKFTERNGQVLLSDYIEIDVPSKGALFGLRSSDGLMYDSDNRTTNDFTIKLEPGTRNLILIHQMDANSVEIEQKLLQDNNYRISILYQIIPYLLISMSEVLFSITILELAYQIAPDTMKSVFMAIGSLTTALGNMLTVVVESLHLFDNVVHDFLFYAALMTVDSLIFAYLGYCYTRGRAKRSTARE